MTTWKSSIISHRLHCLEDITSLPPLLPLPPSPLTNLGNGIVELVHIISQQSPEAREDLPVPGVILQSHLLLHLAIVNLHWTKALHRVSRVNGLARLPEIDRNAISKHNVIVASWKKDNLPRTAAGRQAG